MESTSSKSQEAKMNCEDCLSKTEEVKKNVKFPVKGVHQKLKGIRSIHNFEEEDAIYSDSEPYDYDTQIVSDDEEEHDIACKSS